MLFDKDMRWQFTNRQLMDFQRFTPDIAGPGVSADDILRFQARRGDFGAIPESEVEAEAQRRVSAPLRSVFAAKPERIARPSR